MLILLAAIVCSGVDLRWQIGARAELRARARNNSDTPLPAGPSGPTGSGDTRTTALPALDVELQPALRGALLSRRLSLSASYTPRIILPNIDASKGSEAVLHQWSGGLQTQLSRRIALDIGETASYGVTDFSSLIGLSTNGFGATPNPVLQAVPLDLRRVATMTSRTQVGIRARATRQVSISGYAYYSVSGGLSRREQRNLPLQYGPGVQFDISARVARKNTLGLRAEATHTDFTPPPDPEAPVGEDRRLASGQSFTIGQLSGQWSYQFANDSVLRAEAGVAVVRAYLPTDTFYTVTIAPLAVGIYQHRVQGPGGTLLLQLRAAIVPFLDRVLAAFYERVELGGSLRWRVTDRFQLSAQAQWTLAVLDPNYNGQQLALGELGTLVRLTRHLSLDAGTRLLYSVPSRAVVNTLRQQAAEQAERQATDADRDGLLAATEQRITQLTQFQWLAFVGVSMSFGGHR